MSATERNTTADSLRAIITRLPLNIGGRPADNFCPTHEYDLQTMRHVQNKMHNRVNVAVAADMPFIDFGKHVALFGSYLIRAMMSHTFAIHDVNIMVDWDVAYYQLRDCLQDNGYVLCGQNCAGDRLPDTVLGWCAFHLQVATATWPAIIHITQVTCINNHAECFTGNFARTYYRGPAMNMTEFDDSLRDAYSCRIALRGISGRHYTIESIVAFIAKWRQRGWTVDNVLDFSRKLVAVSHNEAAFATNYWSIQTYFNPPVVKERVEVAATMTASASAAIHIANNIAPTLIVEIVSESVEDGERTAATESAATTFATVAALSPQIADAIAAVAEHVDPELYAEITAPTPAPAPPTREQPPRFLRQIETRIEATAVAAAATNRILTWQEIAELSGRENAARIVAALRAEALPFDLFRARLHDVCASIAAILTRPPHGLTPMAHMHMQCTWRELDMVYGHTTPPPILRGKLGEIRAHRTGARRVQYRK